MMKPIKTLWRSIQEGFKSDSESYYLRQRIDNVRQLSTKLSKETNELKGKLLASESVYEQEINDIVDIVDQLLKEISKR